MMYIKLSSALFVIAYWVFCEGQTDYSKIDPDKKRYMDYTEEMLDGRTELFMKWGIGGPLHNNTRVCWTSYFLGDVVPQFRRTDRYYNKTETDNGRWEKRDAYWSVGAVNYTPIVGVKSYVYHNDQAKPDPKTSGDYVLFFATNTCFVMGLLEDQLSMKGIEYFPGGIAQPACQLWVQRHTNRTQEKTDCDGAFNSTCSSIAGYMYRRGHNKCNFTDNKGAS